MERERVGEMTFCPPSASLCGGDILQATQLNSGYNATAEVRKKIHPLQSRPSRHIT